jgi:hypothetical protein
MEFKTEASAAPHLRFVVYHDLCGIDAPLQPAPPNLKVEGKGDWSRP